MCGRTADLAWLAQRGILTVGVELVREPLQKWAAEYGGVEPVAEVPAAGASPGTPPAITVYRALRYPTLFLVHGDVMAVDRERVLPGLSFDVVWDRGGLTSIPSADGRATYMAHLRTLARPATGALLLEFLTCNLDGSVVPGNVSLPEVHAALQRGGWQTHATALPAGSLEEAEEGGEGAPWTGEGRVVREADVRGAYPSFNPPGLAWLREVVVVAGVGR
jgi:hypothetical protein